MGWSEKNTVETINRNVNLHLNMTPKEALDAFMQTLKGAGNLQKVEAE
jgi:hypothetical protein